MWVKGLTQVTQVVVSSGDLNGAAWTPSSQPSHRSDIPRPQTLMVMPGSSPPDPSVPAVSSPTWTTHQLPATCWKCLAHKVNCFGAAVTRLGSQTSHLWPHPTEQGVESRERGPQGPGLLGHTVPPRPCPPWETGASGHEEGPTPDTQH